MTNWLRGTGVAIVTPFTTSGAVDYAALDRLVSHLIQGNVEYLVVLGTTGEAATLSAEEQDKVIKQVKESTQGRLPIVLGIGGNHTAAIVEKIQDWEKVYQPDAILSVSPYYNKPTQEGIFQHYAALASATNLPLILYNVPGRTASNMSAETTLRLAQGFANIVATKEASGNFEQCMHIMAEKPEGFQLISGEDSIALPLMALGATGVISVAANAIPGPFSDLVRAALAGDFEGARKLQYQLLDLMNLNFVEGNPAGVKALLAIQEICEKTVRLPLVEASAALSQRMKQAWEKAF
ncbi:MAG: 4-hydroxy-tetrahydrodipicolinate synthase [Bacteroidia bacterium]|nr:4-hydroxy-tetrahydrodipicolinate synthase [Bacteroidia bacterium]